MLNPSRGPSYLLPTANQHSLDFVSRWRAFLDALSWFCDYAQGGRTVSSVAGEAMPDRSTRYWLASKNEISAGHLRWLLALLETTNQGTKEHRAEAQLTIAETFIALSKAKIRNYCRFLSISVDRARQATEGALLDQAHELLQALQHLRDQSDPLEVCRTAFAFSHMVSLNQMVETTTEIGIPSKWSAVRHYVARLRSWHRKSALVVTFCTRFPTLLDQHSFSWIGLPAGVRLPPSDAKTVLLGALKRMLPKDQQHTANEMHDAFTSLRDLEFGAKFEDNYAGEKLTLAVHSEVFLMEHFYLNRLRFVDNDRYMGCSKPSCYCCSLYMRYHPGNFVVRPSHGTAWVTWNPPLQARIDDEVIRKHNLDVMNRVVEHIRRDVLNEIQARLPRLQRRPDSSSGIGSHSFD